jgi:hypothetical protein
MKTARSQNEERRHTISLDLGDKSSAYCDLDEVGTVVSEHKYVPRRKHFRIVSQR